MLFLTLSLALTAFWIGMLVECARRILNGDTRQVGWLIVIALTHGFGALAYFFLGRRSATVAQP
ncbi:MAG: PLDc N-terminal domain-containing protein [Verrucomicrobiales bacterium]